MQRHWLSYSFTHLYEYECDLPVVLHHGRLNPPPQVCPVGVVVCADGGDLDVLEGDHSRTSTSNHGANAILVVMHGDTPPPPHTKRCIFHQSGASILHTSSGSCSVIRVPSYVALVGILGYMLCHGRIDPPVVIDISALSVFVVLILHDLTAPPRSCPFCVLRRDW